MCQFENKKSEFAQPNSLYSESSILRVLPILGNIVKVHSSRYTAPIRSWTGCRRHLYLRMSRIPWHITEIIDHSRSHRTAQELNLGKTHSYKMHTMPRNRLCCTFGMSFRVTSDPSFVLRSSVSSGSTSSSFVFRSISRIVLHHNTNNAKHMCLSNVLMIVLENVIEEVLCLFLPHLLTLHLCRSLAAPQGCRFNLFWVFFLAAKPLLHKYMPGFVQAFSTRWWPPWIHILFINFCSTIPGPALNA